MANTGTNSGEIFYLEEFFNKQKANQVRLVQGNSGQSDQVIIKGFTQSESFSLSVSHNFEKLDGIQGIQKIGGIINQFRKEAAYGGAIAEGIGNSIDAVTSKYFNDSESLKSIGTTIKDFGTKVSKFVQGYSQMEFDTADAYLYIFNGTQVSIPTRFTQILITDEVNRDIEDELLKIMNILMGEFTTDESGFVGLTSPPNKFRTTLNGLKGDAPEGTFTMYYGDYRFPGVVVDGIDIDISKTRVKCKNGYKPLFIQVDYSVKPVIKYTKKHMNKWLSGNKSNKV